jgi:uncharacterized protein (DUF486 family)
MKILKFTNFFLKHGLMGLGEDSQNDTTNHLLSSCIFIFSVQALYCLNNKIPNTFYNARQKTHMSEFSRTAFFTNFANFFLRDDLTDFAEIVQGDTRNDLLWGPIFIFAPALLSPE